MPNLSTLQMKTLQDFRATHPGPVGIILEDDQGYDALVTYLTGEPVDVTQMYDVKDNMNVRIFWGHGNGPPQPVNLREATQSYRWCFILFCATHGRDDIAAQIDEMLDEGQELDRLVLVNYSLDQSEAKDDLRRLFAMIPTVHLYFPDARHLFEIDAGEYTNGAGARHVAGLFEHLRRADLPLFTTSYREFRRALEQLGSQDTPEAAMMAVRKRLTKCTDVGYQLNAPWLPPREVFWASIESAFSNFAPGEET